MEEKYFDPTKVIIRKIEKRIAEEMIVKYHYSHKFSLCQIAYGVFYITDNSCKFVDAIEEKLVGTCVFSQPCGRSAAESISSLIKIEECMELIRLVILDNYGRNIESYTISQCLKLLKKDFPYVKCVISYADGEVGHKGGIYQATNFNYQGCGSVALMPNYSVSLSDNPYKWLHSRTVSSRYGSHNLEFLKKKICHTFYRKRESSKYRYFYLLGNKKEKREIMKNLKHPILPYPKENVYKDEIEKIVVSEGLIENQFFG